MITTQIKSELKNKDFIPISEYSFMKLYKDELFEIEYKNNKYSYKHTVNATELTVCYGLTHNQLINEIKNLKHE